MATYERFRAGMDHAMRAAEPARVDALRRVLHAIGDPDQRLAIIHIAGTNGKGSTGAFIAQTLQNAGYRVGHFASPAIGSELKQTQINHQPISADAYAAAMTKIMAQAGITAAAFTDFEWDVLVTLVWFAEQACDWVLLEAGLGGATDATNAIAAPKAAVFTHIALDHTAILGPTVAAIAANKAQIIKPQTTVFIAPHQDPAAVAVLRQTARANGAAAVHQADAALQAQATSWDGTTARLPDGTTVVVRMLGPYQLDNASTALAVCRWLVAQGVLASLAPLKAALASVQLPGRLQVLQRTPRVVLDAGHNPDALPKVLATMRAMLAADGRLLVVAGFLRDKDIAKLAADLAAADAVWVTTPVHPTRALPASELQALVPGSTIAASAASGLAAAEKAARPDDVILVAGSFYLIGGLL